MSSNLVNLAAGLVVLGLTCKICGDMFDGTGHTCPNCRKAKRKTKKVATQLKKDATAMADRQPKMDLPKVKTKRRKPKSDSWMDW